MLLIEYDGEQHFKPVQYGGISIEQATEKFLQTQIHDNIKDQYCEEYNIPLLRIPYWEFDNIESIVFDTLVKYNLLQLVHI